MGTAVHAGLPRKRKLISADRHLLFHRPPHSIRRKLLDEAARRCRGPPSRCQLRKKWKTGQGKERYAVTRWKIAGAFALGTSIITALGWVVSLFAGKIVAWVVSLFR